MRGDKGGTGDSFCPPPLSLEVAKVIQKVNCPIFNYVSHLHI